LQNASSSLGTKYWEKIKSGCKINILEVEIGDYVETPKGWILVSQINHSVADLNHPSFNGKYITGQNLGSESSALVSYDKDSNPSLEAISAIRPKTTS
jgi:hypothetical protein